MCFYMLLYIEIQCHGTVGVLCDIFDRFLYIFRNFSKNNEFPYATVKHFLKPSTPLAHFNYLHIQATFHCFIVYSKN